MKRIFVCSKFRGDTEENINFTRLACKIVTRFGHAPFAPHLIYPQFLDDDDPTDRNMGIASGYAYMDMCNEIWVFKRDNTEKNSSGMDYEIKRAVSSGIPVKTVIVHKKPENKTARIEFIDVGELWLKVEEKHLSRL